MSFKRELPLFIMHHTMHALSCYRYRKKGEEESENEDSSSDESEASIRDEVDVAASNV